MLRYLVVGVIALGRCGVQHRRARGRRAMLQAGGLSARDGANPESRSEEDATIHAPNFGVKTEKSRCSLGSIQVVRPGVSCGTTSSCCLYAMRSFETRTFQFML
jgi:hypothetical protein